MADRTFNILTQLSLNSEDFKRSIESAKDNVKALTLGFDGATGNVQEMRKALMLLRNTSFAGKSVEEIKAINQQIGNLTDEMGDLKAQQKAMGTEFGSLMAKGLQAFGAIIEVGVGVATMFGASKEQAAKYQQIMTSLIGVMQGLGVIQDSLETKIFKTMFARIAETASLVAETVATKIATATQWLFNASLSVMLGVIALVIVAVGTVVVGLYYLYGWLSKSTDAEKQNLAAMKASNDERIRSKQIIEDVGKATQDTLIPQKVHIDNLVGSINNENISLSDKKKKIAELIALDPNYLKGITDANINTETGKKIIGNYISALGKKAESQALESSLVKLYSQQYQDGIIMENLLLGIQAENIVLVNRLKKGDFSFGEAQALRNKIQGESDLYTATARRIGGTITLIDNLQNKISTLKPVDVDYNTGGTKDKKPKTETESKGTVSSTDNILNRRIENNNILLKEGAKNAETITKTGLQNIHEIGLNAAKANLGIDIFPLPNKSKYDIKMGEWKQILRDFSDTIKDDIKKLGTDLANSMGEAFGKMFDATTSNKDKWKSFGSGILSAFGNFMSTLGQQLIEMGVLAAMVKAGLSTAFTGAGAVVLIGAGIAFVAAGQILNTVASKGFAYGGIVPGSNYSGDRVPVMANSGEMILNNGQQSNLFSMLNGSIGGGNNVKFEIEGTKLVGVLNNHSRKINNIR